MNVGSTDGIRRMGMRREKHKDITTFVFRCQFSLDPDRLVKHGLRPFLTGVNGNGEQPVGHRRRLFRGRVDGRSSVESGRLELLVLEMRDQQDHHA